MARPTVVLIVMVQAEPDKIVGVVIGRIVIDMGNLALDHSVAMFEAKTKRAAAPRPY